MRSTFIKTLLTLLALLCAVSLHAAPKLPGQAPIQDLEQTKAWVVEVDGEISKGARVYYSDYEVAWLLKVPKHGWLLLSPRGDKSVQRVEEKAFAAKAVGVGATLEPLASSKVVAHYAQSRGVITFELGEHVFTMRPAEPVLGRRAATDLADRHPDFDFKAADYRAKAAKRAAPLEKSMADDVTVRVYFGSWSPICERIVPKIMAVEESWQHVRFEYYGLPKPLTDDPHARELRLSGVPTVVILRDGEEVERLGGRQLDAPEEAIGQALDGAL